MEALDKRGSISAQRTSKPTSPAPANWPGTAKPSAPRRRSRNNQPLRGTVETLATIRFHVGPVGAASRFKLVHNLILGLNRAALAEGLAFAEALGFDAQRLAILRETPATSAALEAKGENGRAI